MDMTPAAVTLQVLTFFKRRCRADLFPEVFTISSQDLGRTPRASSLLSVDGP
jgi:hypothetical protein